MRRMTFVFSMCIALAAFNAAAQTSNVSINGQWLTVQELLILQYQLGTRVPSGHYLVYPNGCWINTTTGYRGCSTGQPGAGYGPQYTGPDYQGGSGRPTSPFTPPVIDTSGGCEAGSCVNIID